MTTAFYSQKKFVPTPPEKGSFPLDHEGECVDFMKKYMSCLRNQGGKTTECRLESSNYLQCRMEKGLMAKESWAKLGYAELDKKEVKDV